MKKPTFIAVIGASAGGTDAFRKLAGILNPNDDVAYIFVQHASRGSIEKLLLQQLQKISAMPCVIPVDQMPLKAGHIYISRADFHIMITSDHHISLAKGPFENRWRPSIDVLFRSAAIHYRENAIGIILTGLLDDGTSGMIAIRNCGGVVIIQEPATAAFPEMPSSVANSIEPDFSIVLEEMPNIIRHIVSGPPRKSVSIPDDILKEAAISERAATGIDIVSSLGEKSEFSCPDCGGALWEMAENNHLKYRCHVGHAFSQAVLEDRQRQELESTLWVSLRLMQERLSLLEKMKEGEGKKIKAMVESQGKRIAELKTHIEKLKSILFASPTNGNTLQTTL